MIDRLKAFFPVGYLCVKFQVSRSAYYAWHADTPAHARQLVLREQVWQAFTDGRHAEGYRKVTARLHRVGIVVNRKTVAACMQDLGLASPAARRQYRRQRIRAVRQPDPTDLLQRRFQADHPGQVLAGDITFVGTQTGWLYVATVIDIASRMVVGVACGARQTGQLVIRALRDAHANGRVRPGAIFHSDHGSQYRSVVFTNWCSSHGVRRSMGARYECWDNAVAESFFSKLKSERLDWITFTSQAHAKAEVFDYIKHYNTNRPHQALDYDTPAERLTLLQAG